MAKQVIQQKEHQIELEECRLRVQVQPVELPVVTTIQVIEWQNSGTCRGAMHLDTGEWGCAWNHSLLSTPRCPAR